MASTYKIYFTNSSGFNNNFAFFSAVPVVTDNGGSPVYSNIIASQYVPSDDGDTTFGIDVTQTYYAWTSVSPVDVQKLPGNNVVTRISNSKLATLGKTGAPGSTFKLIDNAGNPTFDPNSTTYNAPDGTFQIASDPGAFQPDQNFICGLGSVDGNGQRIPVATFAAQPNTIATIKPVVTFYIAQFSSQKGTVVDVNILSNKAAIIDFTGKGVNAAFVNQTAGGGFSVQYGSAKSMVELSQASSSKNKSRPPILNQYDLETLMEIIRKISPVAITLYQCGFDWVGNPTQQQKATAVTSAATAMGSIAGYTVSSRPSAPYTNPSFGVQSANPIGTVRAVWNTVVAGLGPIANNPRTTNGNFADSKTQSNGTEKQQSTNGGERTNGNQVTNNPSHVNNEYASSDLVQLLKGMGGLDVAAH
ncbi:Ff.00g038690.m01.CDS01 [Fusarium sp. VM40]|nr:Ff.00g038690.m01.CDS01 [Fusarium sp. VM40]